MTRAEHDAYWIERYRAVGRHDLADAMLAGTLEPEMPMSIEQEQELDARAERLAYRRPRRPDDEHRLSKLQLLGGGDAAP